MSDFGDRLARLWVAVEEELPAGWTLSLRCASTGLDPADRSTDWVAVAESPDRELLEGRGPDPERALAALRAEINT